MSDEGERPGPRRTHQQGDWWSELYDAETPDTGRASTGDTLDDRFASVTRTVGGAGPRGAEPPRREPRSASRSDTDTVYDREADDGGVFDREAGTDTVYDREADEGEVDDRGGAGRAGSEPRGRGAEERSAAEPAPPPASEWEWFREGDGGREPRESSGPEPEAGTGRPPVRVPAARREPERPEPERPEPPRAAPPAVPPPAPRPASAAPSAPPSAPSWPAAPVPPPAEGDGVADPRTGRPQDGPVAPGRFAWQGGSTGGNGWVTADEARDVPVPDAVPPADPRREPEPDPEPEPVDRPESPAEETTRLRRFAWEPGGTLGGNDESAPEWSGAGGGSVPPPVPADAPAAALPEPEPDGAPGPDATAAEPPTPGGPSAPAPDAEGTPDMLPPTVCPPRPDPVEPWTRRAEPGEPWAADPTALSDLVPDTELDGARHGPLAVRAASLRGDLARERGEPRGDAMLVARFGAGDNALLLVAVATGAGPAPGAHRAAREACHSIGEAIGRSHARLAEDVRAGQKAALKSGLKRLIDRSHGRLRAQAAALGLEPGEHSSDLRCLLLPADPDCRTRVFFGIGSGGLFRLRDGVWQDIEPRVPGGPPPGLAPGPEASVPPLPDPRPTMNLGITRREARARQEEAEPEPFRFRASVARPGDTLLLCSAGLAEPLRASSHFADRLAVRWGQEPGAPDLAAFLVEVQQGGADDGYGEDRTAAAVWEA
ncbi:protein phosphatase 2C domain-containing protein [Streptomyces phytohabitans]|uniref:protein phosphatase 2C domain-containing protein n=1 Tax=Streptomyces phytohabitans TaxID=1150371 RepID=UPI00345C5EB4